MSKMTIINYIAFLNIFSNKKHHFLGLRLLNEPFPLVNFL